MKKEIKLKTKRLIVSPMTVEELDKKLLLMEDGELRQAYQEMLDGCRAHPESAVWYAPWKICRKSDGTELGDAGFKGAPEKGRVEIGYGLEEQYRNQGYMTEAVSALTGWAFGQTDVYIVEAETEEENTASRRVLEKLKFKPNGTGNEGPRFALEKPASAMMSVYMCLGLSVGMSMGIASGNMSIGMCTGFAIGMAIGAGLDSNEKKHRADVLQGVKKPD